MNKDINKLKTEDDVRELIEEWGYEDVLIFSNPSYASAFVGISEDNRAVYEYDKMIDYLADKEGWSDIDAVDFIEYNSIRSLPYYENHPIIIYKLVD